MKNNKILTIAVVVLLLSNIALVAFMLTSKNKKADKRQGGRRETFEVLVKELSMTEEQKKDYKEMKEEHMKNVKPLFDSVRVAKSAFFALTKESNVNDSLINIYNFRVAEKQAELDRVTFDHFRRVRKLFTAEQQPKFDTFMQKMMQRGRRDSADKRK